jgi:trehalose 6-phosphate synthase/phosphatase
MFQTDHWIRLADIELPWKKSVKEIIDYYVERTPGTSVEERNCSYILHYEQAEDLTLAARQAGECCNHVNDLCENYRVHAIPFGGAIIVESMDWTKTTAAQKVMDLEANQDEPVTDFLMVVGDGRDDEPVFSWANDLGRNKIKNVITVKVGTKNTQAISTTSGVPGELGRRMSMLHRCVG